MLSHGKKSGFLDALHVELGGAIILSEQACNTYLFGKQGALRSVRLWNSNGLLRSQRLAPRRQN